MYTISKIKKKAYGKNKSRRVEEVMHNFINKRTPNFKKSYEMKPTIIGDEDTMNVKEQKVPDNLSINLICKLLRFKNLMSEMHKIIG